MEFDNGYRVSWRLDNDPDYIDGNEAIKQSMAEVAVLYNGKFVTEQFTEKTKDYDKDVVFIDVKELSDIIHRVSIL
jgi:hypothetical protein